MRAMYKNEIASWIVAGLSLSLLVGCSSNGGSPTDSSRLQVVNKGLGINIGTGLGGYVPNLNLLATVTPPSVNSTTLQADQAILVGTNVYISYNIAGAGSGGGVDQISVATPVLPILSASKTFATLDVNGVLFDGLNFFVAGNDSVADSPARLQVFGSSLGAMTGLTTDSAQPGYAAVSIKQNLLGTTLYAVTGDNFAGGAGLQVINKSTMATSATYAIADARDVGVGLTGNVYVVTGGNPGSVMAFSSTGTYASSVNIGNTGPSQSKSTIVVGQNYAVASAGTGGVKLICLANMQVVGSAAPAGGGVTNAAAFAGGLIFTADGDAGVTVYSVNLGTAIAGVTGCNNATLTEIGTISFNSYVSANNISYLANLLLVSGGLGGFQIVNVTLPLLTTGLITTL